MLYELILLAIFAPLLSLTYAMRGGQYKFEGPRFLQKVTEITRKIPQGGRLSFLFPLLLFTFLLTPGEWVAPILYFLLCFVAVAMGHGVFMDMGRFVHPSGQEYSRAQPPFTWILGKENYTWPFWKKWIHNATGMSLVGAVRHAPIWVFYYYDVLAMWQCAVFTGLGLAHSLIYEASIHVNRVFKDKLRNNHIFYAEHMIGFYWSICLWISLISF